MSRDGRLIWRGHLVEWKYEAFKSKQDLRLHPHFILRATNENKDFSITYDDVVMPLRLRDVTDFTKLPSDTMQSCLNELIDTLEKEANK